ncbi:MAG: hypothetical protein MR890_03200 [Akkermansia muciniphila]|nr:hypothetical protein [Akkermansia muciniphila]
MKSAPSSARYYLFQNSFYSVVSRFSASLATAMRSLVFLSHSSAPVPSCAEVDVCGASFVDLMHLLLPFAKKIDFFAKKA